jgi:ATP-dependent DNA helicase RecG
LSSKQEPFAGLAPALCKQLAKLGLRQDFDLVLHLPLRYEDETVLTPIAQAVEGKPVAIEATLLSAEVMYRPRRQLVCKLQDDSGLLFVRFLNFYPSQSKSLQPGRRMRLYGEVRPGFFGGEMVHPRYRLVAPGEALPDALTPVYPSTAGLAQSALRKLIAQALARCDLRDSLSADVRDSLKLIPFEDAVRYLHAPPPGADAASLEQRTHPAWTRVKFDELLAQQLSMTMHYRARLARSAAPLPRRADGGLTQALLDTLPFRLTGAQERAWGEIENDLAHPHPMNRLLQGDVGSGKTVIAALAALRAVESGQQVAVMAPTEILAEQHYRKFGEWLAPLGVGVSRLSGAQKAAERRRVAAAAQAGEAQVTVGTHALFQDKVGFARLGLAVVDEQHRFGVRQRLALQQRSAALPTNCVPHQLMMSATPIPRSLSMSYYADLDVSVIDELPPGRMPVMTKLFADTRRAEVIEGVRAACRDGAQVYWVCPLVEESEALDLQTAIDTHAALSAELPELRIGLVHGRLPADEKTARMQAFKEGALQVLVATTVIEVGMDVPNASLMVVEHAERFGLAQLHQLRGRVGRGTAQSACILLYQGPLSEAARQRLRIIYEYSDGFRIAHEDLLLRGPGEYLGARQSGAPLLRFADIVGDNGLLETARNLAGRLLAQAPEAAEFHVQRWLAGGAEWLRA